MKNKLLRQLASVLGLLLVGFLQPVHGQVRSILDPAQGGAVCAGPTYTYVLSNDSDTNGCSTISWVVVGGRITLGQNSRMVSVIWDDVPTNASTTPYSSYLTASASGCNDVSRNNPTPN